MKSVDVGDAGVDEGGEGEMGVGGSDAYARTLSCGMSNKWSSDAGRRRRDLFQLSGLTFVLRAIHSIAKEVTLGIENYPRVLVL